MNSTCRTAIAAAVAGGYVLGRTRKAKAAFAVGTLLAGRRFGLTPTALAGEGLRRLRESPQLADLREQIGGDLMDAARAAASASADRRFSAFAGTLRDRTGTKDTGKEPEDETYEEPDDGEEQEDEGGDGEAQEDREDERDEDGDEDERADRSAARRRGPGHERRRTGKGQGTAQKAAKKPAKKAAPASRAAAKKARPATKTASKKAASGRSHATGTRRGR